jgi:hypothetical protein
LGIADCKIQIEQHGSWSTDLWFYTIRSGGNDCKLGIANCKLQIEQPKTHTAARAAVFFYADFWRYGFSPLLKRGGFSRVFRELANCYQISTAAKRGFLGLPGSRGVVFLGEYGFFWGELLPHVGQRSGGTGGQRTGNGEQGTGELQIGLGGRGRGTGGLQIEQLSQSAAEQ